MRRQIVLHEAECPARVTRQDHPPRAESSTEPYVFNLRRNVRGLPVGLLGRLGFQARSSEPRPSSRRP